MVAKTDQKGFARIILAEFLHRRILKRTNNWVWDCLDKYLPTNGVWSTAMPSYHGAGFYNERGEYETETDSPNGWWCPPSFVPDGIDSTAFRYYSHIPGYVDYFAVAVTDKSALLAWCLRVLGEGKEVLRFPEDSILEGLSGAAYRIEYIHRMAASSLVWLWHHPDSYIVDEYHPSSKRPYSVQVLKLSVVGAATSKPLEKALGLSTLEYVRALTHFVKKYPLVGAGLICGVPLEDKYMQWAYAGMMEEFGDFFRSCGHSGVAEYWTNQAVVKLLTNTARHARNNISVLDQLQWLMGAMYFFDVLSKEHRVSLIATKEMLVGVHRVLRDVGNDVAATMSLNDHEEIKSLGLAAMAVSDYADQAGLEKALSNKIKATDQDYGSKREATP